MTQVFSIVECLVTFNDGTQKTFRPTYAEVSAGLASVDKVSVVNYLKDNLRNEGVRSIEVLDTLYFRSQEEFKRYMNNFQ